MELEQQNKFKITSAYIEPFKTIMTNLKKLEFKEIEFNFNKDNISIKESNVINNIVIDLKLFDSGFVEYDLEKPFIFGFNVDNLKDILKRFKKESILTFKESEKENNIEIIKINDSRTTFTYPSINIDNHKDNITTENLKFNTEVFINSKLLYNTINSFNNKNITIEVFSDKIIFKTENQKTELTINDLTEMGITLKNGKSIKSKYRLEYLKNILKNYRIEENVKLSLNKDYPILFNWYKEDKFDYKIYLAPYLSEDY